MHGRSKTRASFDNCDVQYHGPGLFQGTSRRIRYYPTAAQARTIYAFRSVHLIQFCPDNTKAPRTARSNVDLFRAFPSFSCSFQNVSGITLQRLVLRSNTWNADFGFYYSDEYRMVGLGSCGSIFELSGSQLAFKKGSTEDMRWIYQGCLTFLFSNTIYYCGWAPVHKAAIFARRSGVSLFRLVCLAL